MNNRKKEKYVAEYQKYKIIEMKYEIYNIIQIINKQKELNEDK